MSERTPPAELAGQSAVITGAGQGIGLGIAEALGRAGASVTLLDLDGSRAEGAAAGLRGSGIDAAGVAGDVTDRSSITAALAGAVERLGRLDVLVNNAGVVVFKDFVDHTDADWALVLGVCLTGTFIVSQEALKHMLPRGRGSIINISSIAAFHYTTVHSSYAAAKAGLVALTRDLAYEVGPSGIRVNAIAPGPIQTPLTAGQLDDASRQGWDRVLRLGRWGTPDDIGEAAVFLASDRSGFITGQTISVAGGADIRVMPS